jgi:hypothetical protein
VLSFPRLLNRLFFSRKSVAVRALAAAGAAGCLHHARPRLALWAKGSVGWVASTCKFFGRNCPQSFLVNFWLISVHFLSI